MMCDSPSFYLGGQTLCIVTYKPLNDFHIDTPVVTIRGVQMSVSLFLNHLSIAGCGEAESFPS